MEDPNQLLTLIAEAQAYGRKLFGRKKWRTKQQIPSDQTKLVHRPTEIAKEPKKRGVRKHTEMKDYGQEEKE